MNNIKPESAGQLEQMSVTRNEASGSDGFRPTEFSSAEAAMCADAEKSSAEQGVCVYQVWRIHRQLHESARLRRKRGYRRRLTSTTLLEKVRLGCRIEVVDAKTRKDITHQVLMAFWVECERREPQFSQALLCEFIRLSGSRRGRRALAGAFLDFMASAYADAKSPPA